MPDFKLDLPFGARRRNIGAAGRWRWSLFKIVLCMSERKKAR
jgi:hypothetical protein